ncbi:sodium/hydrogen exchanger 9B2-like isoform X2 [Portunus trituberculatus]|uniref:sodium/hydrogen exchanger 9B2-like isoform X2 n=1 Tax=Portunus trituberculatus TaxID=210409 RepID=UPI001E1CEC09|nr:sodium/hydrogen exchanger 9B2-like isoform X2 [Portunus trituberculatus]
MEGDSIPERLLDNGDTADTASTNDTSQAQVNLAFELTGSSHGSGDEAEKEGDTTSTLADKPEPSQGSTSSPKIDRLPVLEGPTVHRHLRTDSQLSSSEASFAPSSEPDVGRGDDVEGWTTLPPTNRGVEYSEAATLPLGCPSVGEKINEWDGRTDKFTEKKESKGCDACCRCLLRSKHKLPEEPTMAQRIHYSLTCPPHGKVGDILLRLVIGTAVWGCLICITGRLALPGGNLFSLAVLYIAAVLSGRASAAVGMPPLLGSLVAGILFESVPGINAVGHNVDVFWSSVIRNLVLVIILLRAGLGLDPAALRKLSCVVLRLAFLPCVVEAVVAALMTKLLLGLPWLWSFMLGFIVAAVSPAVVVPGLLKLAEEGYGVEAGIPTLVIAAASLDDVLAITGFSVMMGLAFAEGSLVWTLAKGPLEVVAGLVYGVVFGSLCWVLPHQESKDRPAFKFVILFCLGCLGMFGSHKVGLESSGPIAVLSLAFVTGLGWRQSANKVGKIDAGTIGWGLLALLVCLSLRVATSFLVVMGAGFSLLERLFIAIAWLPKATVQAAIGSHALDFVRQHGNDPDDIFRGQQVVTIAVMVILVTAPIGAAAIKLTGPKFLARHQPHDSQA